MVASGEQPKKDAPIEIEYAQAEDYLLPLIALSDSSDAPLIGRYGRMPRAFLIERLSTVSCCLERNCCHICGKLTCLSKNAERRLFRELNR
ncbi:MAG: TnpV protein [Clostridiales bacterium]|nr:TnpV protein [Clostridiales bacterium]